jgi:ATP-dependent DNA helicase
MTDVQSSDRLNKLKSLVSRAGAYSKFLADKLESRQQEMMHENKENGHPTRKRQKKDNDLLIKNSRQPKLVTGCVLRDYQIVGMEWLISLYENGLNGILADEMGLGKTIQTISFLAYLIQVGTAGPFFIVVPLSTLQNWKNEFEKLMRLIRFTPQIEVCLYHGSPTDRAALRKKYLKRSNTLKCPVMITSYEISMNDRKYLHNIPWKYIVVDEGHRIKNMNCKLIRDLKSYTTSNRLLLTGTPLQNNLAELWSLLNFLMPEIFNDLGAFEEWFVFENTIQDLEVPDEAKKLQLENGEQTSMVQSLHQILKPFLLRRIKTDVALDLPKKREYILYAPMVPKQKELYDAILTNKLEMILQEALATRFNQVDQTVAIEDNTDNSLRDTMKLSEKNCNDRSKRLHHRKNYTEREENDLVRTVEHPVVAEPNNKQMISTYVKKLVGNQNLQMSIVQLRKVCNHPYLFHIGTEEHLKKEHSKEITEWSGKMLLLDRLLTALLNGDHKVLIFSQMTSMLDIICDWLEFDKKLPFCRIDGDVSLADRQAQIEMFNKDPNIKVFLLSTRAGGLGINLTAADTVIIFDSDWNPQADLQAQDRVHRIGQKRPVIVYRFVTANSIEKKILDRARSKRTLEKVVIHKSEF